MLRPTIVITALVAASLLTGCGDGANPSDPGVTPLSEQLPACSEVWVEGKPLPEGYAGCVGDGGVLSAPALIKCTAMDGAFTTYDDRFFVLAGGPIHQGGADAELYQQSLATCTGTS